ncbi:MAG: acylphosphatase [Candidatus Micrarchaeota archaeon]
MTLTLHIKVFGRVQGVFFRIETTNLALKLGLYGWVKNIADGSVEILAEGDHKSLEKLLEWCYYGPAEAEVKELEYIWGESKNNLTKFSIIR